MAVWVQWEGPNLEVRAGDAGSDLFEESLLNSDELRRLDHIQDLLDLSQEHHLQTHTLICETLFIKLLHTHRCTETQTHTHTGWSLTSFWVQVLGQYLSSPRMI